MYRFIKNITGVQDFLESAQQGANSFSLPIQLAEDSERFVVRSLAPGMKKENLEITLSGQTLNICGSIPCQGGNFLRQECPCGTFRRSLELGALVDGEAVEAKLEAGVLTIILPKHKPARSSRIQVNYGSKA